MTRLVTDIDGMAPAATASPASIDEVAALLAEASAQRRSTVIMGAGSKLTWGRRPGPIDLALDLSQLNNVVEHVHGDLTATFEAGVTLRAANAALARHGQWLPLDPVSAEHATIGGLLATNDAGPLRHRHGTPRDLVIGVRLATTTGAVAKAGGRVVKNVAGYDISKLLTGSFGCLAAIVHATFKLAPLPETTGSVILRVNSPGAAGALLRDLMHAQLDPQRFEVTIDVRPGDGAQVSLGLRFASVAAAVEAQLSRVVEIGRTHGATADLVAGVDEAAFWESRHVNAAQGDLLLQANWRPAALNDVCATLVAAAVGTRGVTLSGRAALGTGLIRVDADHDAQIAVLDHVRHSPHLGHVVVRRASPAVRDQVDVWGSLGDRAAILHALKRTFDPQGILNAGRGPI